MSYFKACVEAATEQGMTVEEAVDLVVSCYEDLMGSEISEDESIPEEWDVVAKEDSMLEMIQAVAMELAGVDLGEDDPEDEDE